MADDNRGDYDWLEGGDLADDDAAELVPVALATKAQLAAATGLTITALDRLVRDGAPVARRGTSRKQGLRFSLPTFFAWYVERAVSRRAAAGADANDARARAAEALAKLREYEIQKREGELIDVDSVKEWVSKHFGEIRTRIVQLSTQVQNLTVDQTEELEDAIHQLLLELCGEGEPRELDRRKTKGAASTPDEVDTTVNGDGKTPEVNGAIAAATSDPKPEATKAGAKPVKRAAS